MAHLEHGPLPPSDFASRTLPVDTWQPGATLFRIHRSELDALYFGKTGLSRFDDPEAAYGVCYLATTFEAAFAETCLRAVGAQFVGAGFIAQRAVTRIATVRSLRLLPLHGPALAAIGATGAVTSGAYPLSQAWSLAIHNHPDALDGILYRANHDNGEICVALFDRAIDALDVIETEFLGENRQRLANVLERYRVGLG